MDILRRLDAVNPGNGTIVTIGSFDGIHRGHQALLQETERLATTQQLKSVLLTFDPHPQILLRDKTRPGIRLLSTLEEKEFLINRLFDLDAFLVLDFTAGFSEMTAKEFVTDILVQKLQAKHVVVGYDHRFGHDRAGDVDFLKTEGAELGFAVTAMGPIMENGHPMSSTRIRDAIQGNDLDLANRLLGHPYTVYGTVVRGKGRGRALNYPTANIQPPIPNKLIPARGVYLAKASFDGHRHFGMCNIGIRPTFEDELSHDIVEINLFDWNGDENSLYDKTLLIEFYQKIRAEKTFASPRDLKDQLGKDKEECLKIIENL
ncbi:MAG: riboflavin biosynthesis protein RibF [Lentisphaeria bacterium]|nr:riboflavin biosynthesis protein RibF [Candidatus Neomarinimicrobiota bacterium]MCF7841662.1 riboflavin biosynthesis protein RibF [Lentisphaeria bacterium]